MCRYIYVRFSPFYFERKCEITNTTVVVCRCTPFFGWSVCKGWRDQHSPPQASFLVMLLWVDQELECWTVRRTGWLTSGTVLPTLLGWVVPIAIFCDIDTGHEEMFSVYADDKTIIAFLPTTHCTFVTLCTTLFLTRTFNAAHPCQNDNALKHILKLNQCVST